MSMMTTARPASVKQYHFIKKLLGERDITAIAERVENDRAWAAAGQFSTADASALIDLLLAQPKGSTPVAPAPTRELQAGIYQSGADLIRVYLGQQSGALLAKLIVTDNGALVSYDYLGAAARVLPADAVRLSVEEVGALGKTFDHCLCCGRRLDDPESVDRGIGPVCAKKY